jgi:hypothetical protein
MVVLNPPRRAVYTFDELLDTYRRPDGHRWTGQQLDEATGGVVEAEIATLANVYRFVLASANENAAGVTSTNDTSVRNTEEVSDVDHRPDRPSEVT